MAKIAKKKQVPTANPRSRAAKRATSPSINVDKSLKETPRVLGTDPILGVAQNSGISKKKKTKQMTRGQRARQEKGLARAEAVMDQMEKKVDGAKAKLKNRNTRKAQWDDVNETVEEQKKTVRVPGLEILNNEGDVFSEEEPQHTDDIDMGVANASSLPESTPAAVQPETSTKPTISPLSNLPQQDDPDLIT